MIAILITPFLQYYHNYHYFIPYVVAASMLAAAILLFCIGWQYYLHIKSDETVVANYIPVVINAFQSRNQYNKNNQSIDKSKSHATSSTLLNVSQSLTEEERSIQIDHRPSTFLDFAKVPNGKFHDRIVDDVKSLRSAFIVFGLLIPYWIVYDQVK